MNNVLKYCLVILIVAGGLALWNQSVAQRASLRPSFGEEGQIDPFQQDISGLSPHEAAVFWTDWGDHYAHEGPADKMFVCFTKAVQTSSQDAEFYEALADSIFTYRKDAKEFYQLSEQQVFDLALSCYRAAFDREPESFARAKEIARCYYVITPRRLEDAVAAWQGALKLAQTDLDKQDVYVNLARLYAAENKFAEANEWLKLVTHPSHLQFKAVIEHNIKVRSSAPEQAPVAPEPLVVTAEAPVKAKAKARPHHHHPARS